MPRESFLSRFTPSLLRPETLEAILVKRQKLAARLVDLIVESATTANKHYMLLVGPRGIGKTHMVSLVYNRIKQNSDIQDRLRIAWLREEEWGVASFLDLLLSILRALHQEYRDRELAVECESLRRLTIEEAELVAEGLLRRTVGDKTLLVTCENLDEIFRSIGEEGQAKLRAYIQNNPFFTILATSQSLFNGVSLRTSPFYGFFEIHHLQELSFEEAVEMLAKIAEHEGDPGLATHIRTVKGRARIRAVHHLAAGNPRAYVIFAQFLSRESLDQLVEPFMRTLDDLTPYYEARMRQLSPQQRKITEFLCDVRHAVTVREVAESKFMTHQTASGQLKKLRDMSYVRSHQCGRESFYELREPLMKLCLEVKKLRGEPIRWFVEFLRLWYSYTELTNGVSSLGPDARSEQEYTTQALRASEERSVDSNVVACSRDDQKYDESFEFDRALETAVEKAMELDGNDERGALGALGQGLVRTIRTLAIPRLDDDVATSWNQVWQELGAGHRDLEVPLRLLDAAVRYRVEHDERILLRLPIEERKLLEPLLEIR